MRQALKLFAVLGIGCGSVLTPVKTQAPQALTGQSRTPRVVWVVDKSGSMTDPLAVGGQPRIDVLKTWFEGAATTLSAPARHGLVFFPSDTSCGAASRFAVEVPVDVASQPMADVVAQVQAVVPGGGTPTKTTLHFLAGALPIEPTTRTLVVLMTDGLPNCNPLNPASCTDPAACQCTLQSCGTVGSQYCILGCLDDQGVFGASQELSNLGDELMVVAVGQDVASAPVLTAMVQPLARTCSSDVDCKAGSSCDVAQGLCAERFFSVTSVGDFDRPVRRLAKELAETQRCVWWLDQDVSTGTLTVTLDGVAVSPGADGYAVKGTRQVRFGGSACAQLLSSDSVTPGFAWKAPL